MTFGRTSLLFSVYSVIFLSISIRMISAESKQNQNSHSIVKRQTSLAPFLPQTSYTFTTNCISGSQVGSVGASSFGGGTITYTADPGTGSPSYVYVNPTTGQIVLTTSTATSFMFNLRAMNNYGSIAVPVTVMCSGSSNGGTAQSYYLTAYSCTPGSTIGAVNIPGATGYYVTGGSGAGLFSISASGAITATGTLTPGQTYYLNVYSYGNIFGGQSTMTVTITVPTTGSNCGNQYPYGQTVTFNQQSYNFPVSTCTVYQGALVGYVSAMNAYSYQITTNSGGQFSVAANGQITALTTLSTGTYYLYVTAYGVNGASAQVPVTISITCGGSQTQYGLPPTWNLQSYGFTVQQCNPGVNYVGTVSASNSLGYSINYGGSQFTVDNSGNIYTSGSVILSSNVYSLTVVATGSTGAQVAVPVSVTVVCYIRRAPARG